LLLLTFAVALYSGCAAVQTQMDYGDLKLFCYPGEPVFLETQPKTAYVAVQAPAEITGLKDAVEQKLKLKGINIVDSPEQADITYVVSLSNASVQETAASDVNKFGGPSAAGSLGAGTGIATLSGGDLTSVGIGSAAAFVGGTVVNMTINRWVTLNDLRIRADVQVREKLPVEKKGRGVAAAVATPGAGDGYAYHQTYIVVRAQKANLTWEECASEVKARLVKEITSAI
jgi:hypothetical protein